MTGRNSESGHLRPAHSFSRRPERGIAHRRIAPHHSADAGRSKYTSILPAAPWATMALNKGFTTQIVMAPRSPSRIRHAQRRSGGTRRSAVQGPPPPRLALSASLAAHACSAACRSAGDIAQPTKTPPTRSPSRITRECLLLSHRNVNVSLTCPGTTDGLVRRAMYALAACSGAGITRALALGVDIAFGADGDGSASCSGPSSASRRGRHRLTEASVGPANAVLTAVSDNSRIGYTHLEDGRPR
jgi:hypothetical protein